MTRMKQKNRQLIFEKYGGRCAYCGIELTKGWHVDEIEPVRRIKEYDYTKRKYVLAGIMHPERLCIENQNPACASCNINKHSDSLEDFRNLIQGFMKHLNEHNTQYKIAKRYGLVKEDIKPVVFYFETLNPNPND
jgi:5-methylcytosine-specific restriction endonuclease McrA